MARVEMASLPVKPIQLGEPNNSELQMGGVIRPRKKLKKNHKKKQNKETNKTIFFKNQKPFPIPLIRGHINLRYLTLCL